MATAGPLPIQRVHEKKHHSPSLQPIDAKLLAAKLEAAQRERDVARARKHQRDSAKTGGYFPRHAAHQLMATTTPMMNEGFKPKRDTSSSRSKPPTAIDRCAPRNPKQRLLATDVPTATSDSRRPVGALTSRRSSAGDADSIRLARKKASTDRMHKPAAVDDSAAHAGPNGATPHRSASARVYKPGDTAKRRTLHPGTPLHSHVDRTIPLHALSSHSEALPEGPSRSAGEKYDLHALQAFLDGASNSRASGEGPQRPGMPLPHDRPHWAQASECGDSMRDLLRQSKRQDGEIATKAKSGEKGGRRESLMGFLRKARGS